MWCRHRLRKENKNVMNLGGCSVPFISRMCFALGLHNTASTALTASTAPWTTRLRYLTSTAPKFGVEVWVPSRLNPKNRNFFCSLFLQILKRVLESSDFPYQSRILITPKTRENHGVPLGPLFGA